MTLTCIHNEPAESHRAVAGPQQKKRHIATWLQRSVRWVAFYPVQSRAGFLLETLADLQG